MGYRIVKVQMPRSVWLTPDEAAAVTADTVKNQTARRWDAEGAADGHPKWPAHTPFTKSLGYARRILAQSRMLRNATVANRPAVTISGRTVRLDFSSPIRTKTGHNLGAIHQYGVPREILPLNAGALFLPKRHPGNVNKKTKKVSPPKGGFQRSRRSIRLRVGPTISRDGRVVKSGYQHYGQTGKKGSGASPKLVDLEKNRDFVLLDKIPLKSYPEGSFSVPPRPIFAVTKQNREEIKERLVEAYQHKAGKR